MANDQKVKDLMIPLEDYPHIPHWFTLRQAMALVREAAIKYEGAFEPRAMLVFDDKYQLMGILTIRDIITGLEPRFLQETSLVQIDPNQTPNMKEHSERLVSEVMSPIKATVDSNAPIFKPLCLMIKENVGLMPVIRAGKVAGMIRFSDLFNEIAKMVLGDQA
jgi:signal-transduction protein with cAMP-binding, CBS, and nucleotidyltransferase domain